MPQACHHKQTLLATVSSPEVLGFSVSEAILIDFHFSISSARVYAVGNLLPQMRRARRMSKRLQRCRAAPRWKSKFARFVMAYGVDRLAKGLDILPSAIYHWIRGATAPRPAHAAIIQRLARASGVKLTLDQIYRHSRDLRAGERESGPTSFSDNGIPETSFAHASAK